MINLYVADEQNMTIIHYEKKEGIVFKDNPNLREISFIPEKSFYRKDNKPITLTYAITGKQVDKLTFLPSKRLSWVVLEERDDEKAIQEFHNFYKDSMEYFTLQNIEIEKEEEYEHE